MEESGQRDKKKARRETLLLRLWRNIIRGPRSKGVEEEEAISFGNYEVIGILTDSIFSRAVGTRPIGDLGVIMDINDERYERWNKLTFIDVWKQNQRDT